MQERHDDHIPQPLIDNNQPVSTVNMYNNSRHINPLFGASSSSIPTGQVGLPSPIGGAVYEPNGIPVGYNANIHNTMFNNEEGEMMMYQQQQQTLHNNNNMMMEQQLQG